MREGEEKIVRKSCPKCGKILEGLSEKHLLHNLKVHLIASIRHHFSIEETEEIIRKMSKHV